MGPILSFWLQKLHQKIAFYSAIISFYPFGNWVLLSFSIHKSLPEEEFWVDKVTMCHTARNVSHLWSMSTPCSFNVNFGQNNTIYSMAWIQRGSIQGTLHHILLSTTTNALQSTICNQENPASSWGTYRAYGSSRRFLSARTRKTSWRKEDGATSGLQSLQKAILSQEKEEN